MIRFLRQCDFSPGLFVKGIPLFIWRYLTSRSFLSLLGALPGVLFSLAVVAAWVWGGMQTNRETLRTRYEELSRQAVVDGDLAGAETYFSRVLSTSENPQATSFEFATRIYKESGAENERRVHIPVPGITVEPVDNPFLQRSLAMLTALAPRRRDASGYPPAHQFLADYWRTREPQNEVTHVLSLKHETYRVPHDKAPAMRLAKYIADRGYHSQAIEVLTPHQYGEPDVLLQLAVSYSKNGDVGNTQHCLKEATQLLQNKLQANPEDIEIRLTFSRAIAAQGQILESMFVLVEGCAEGHSEKLVDPLIQRYLVWLSSMSESRIRAQLQEIDVALRFSGEESERPSGIGKFEHLTLSTGKEVSLPTPIVRFHKAMLTNNHRYLAALLLGTEKATQGKLQEAIVLLEKAHQDAPDHPVVANNLAWTLFLKARADADANNEANAAEEQIESKPENVASSHNTNDNDSQLNTAWALSTVAVETCPDNLSFRATRGKLAAYTKRWSIAEQDLRICLDGGDASVDVRTLLNLAERNLKAE